MRALACSAAAQTSCARLLDEVKVVELPLRLRLRRVGLAALLAGLAASSAAADQPPAGPDQPARVLLPTTAPRLQAAFARAVPAWRLDSAAIARDRVDVRACAGPACYSLQLLAPQPCSGVVAGPWCVVWAGPPPTDADALHRALAADPPADLWHVIAARPAQPPIIAAPPPANPSATAALLPAPGEVTASAAPAHPQAADARAGAKPDRDVWWRMLVFGLVVGGAALLMLRGLGPRSR